MNIFLTSLVSMFGGRRKKGTIFRMFTTYFYDCLERILVSCIIFKSRHVWSKIVFIVKFMKLELIVIETFVKNCCSIHHPYKKWIMCVQSIKKQNLNLLVNLKGKDLKNEGKRKHYKCNYSHFNGLNCMENQLRKHPLLKLKIILCNFDADWYR